MDAIATHEPLKDRQLLKALRSFRKGDFSARLPSDLTGIDGDIAETFNDVVELNQQLVKELSRLSTAVGKEGKISQRAKLSDAKGGWQTCIDAVNSLIGDMAHPTAEVARVIGAVAKGDLSQTMVLEIDGRPLRGEFLRIGRVVNTMVGQLSSFASEVTRVAREVGTEGKLGGQADVKGVAGTWKDLTDNVNLMATNLTSQVRNIAEVTTAVANGDLSKKITVDVKGEILELKDTINTMVDQLSSFASEVTRVAREVGTEGKLGGQAQVKGVAGTWKDLTDNVNMMATNLTSQVRNIAEVTTAVANGDLSKKITVDVKGEILELKDTINTMVDQLGSFASEVSRVAREVGTEGKLGGQAQVGGVAGTWKDLTDNVNAMATNLTGQVRNIAEVTTAVANGDLSKKITVDVKGEILELKDTINTMVDQLSSFASEVSRVAREVGTEGKLGGQADVKGVAGTWKDLTDNVNAMATNLTGQVRNIAEVTTAVARGDLSKKITVDVKGEILELKDTINTMVDQLSSFASEVSRVAREVGTEGELGGQAQVVGVAGTWKDLTDNVNAMATNLTSQVRNIAEVTTAVANGDLSKKITVDVKGEILELKDTINTMVDQLGSFASEVSRVAREVGTDGKLGGQAQVVGVAGTWKDLTDNVNAMATNLTSQVRGIADVVTAVAKGDLTRKLTVDAKGEIAALAETINGMIVTLATFGDQVTNVAREVGIEGKLGGQARVPGAAGLWRDLTDNVNQLAANLTTQVRAIAEVATAVTKGDLTRSITVEASGEVAALKDNINEMIRNLEDTTLKNTEQDWLKTNLARFTRRLQGERDLVTVSNLVLSELAPLVGAQQGVFYMGRTEEDDDEEETILELLASYAYKERKSLSNRYRLREGLVGQCAFEKQRILLTEVPSSYIQINSGLGEAPPLNIVVLPVLFEGEVQAVLELASFNRFNEAHLSFLDQLMESIGIVLNTIATNMRTEDLLKQSQRLTSELQSQQEELRNTNDRLEQQAATLRQSEDLLKAQREELRRKNDELQEKAQLLAVEKRQVEATNMEVERAKQAVEEKAEQLALTSRYKSEFLANMSHELRTPLNSMLVLSKLLAENNDTNLSDKQIEFARTIHSSGNDLLSLINEILDLSKIESGAMRVEIDELRFDAIEAHLRRTFDPVATEKKLDFTIELDESLPEHIVTDAMRLQQVLFNLLSNAFKFTEKGGVTLRAERATEGWSPDHPVLGIAGTVVAFAISDTGIGITEANQRIIFEAFQQGDGSTSRKYGGTGLGLSICREIARLLGAEIIVRSVPGKGSTFTLFMPADLTPDEAQEAPEQSGTADADAADLSEVPLPRAITDDRRQLDGSVPAVLIVEDDMSFANVLLDVVRETGMKGVVAGRGREVLAIAREAAIDAISLDIGLPDTDGWALLDRLKHDPATRHIPVHIISVQEQRPYGLRMGAFGFTGKPAEREELLASFARLKEFCERRERRLLLVDGDGGNEFAEQLGSSRKVVVRSVAANKAVRELEAGGYDCVAVDLAVDPVGVLDFLIALKDGQVPDTLPIVIDARTEPEQATADALRQPMPWVNRWTTDSTEALVDTVAFCLHQEIAGLSAPAQAAIDAIAKASPVLAGSKVAIIDDDIRNIFSITSLLERHRIDVIHAEDGRSGIEMVRNTPDIDIVLVDIMMPEMDGYETIQRIRRLDGRFARLPLIAVTAKAMPEDRMKSISAGASEYVSKPVDPDQLISTVRTWLHRTRAGDGSS
ncbi:MAG: HAMP domain-containing protein [Thalassobaculum sp.]|uniref:HAMP domain-containing protein n=1 Tax=Thalassobaculum sp. TaxID=2022740 RepID=UPI0032EDFDE2